MLPPLRTKTWPGARVSSFAMDASTLDRGSCLTIRSSSAASLMSASFITYPNMDTAMKMARPWVLSENLCTEAS